MGLITLEDVSFTYTYADRPALEGVSLTIDEGVVYGIVGPNGSGKSTLCGVIRGTIPHFHPGTLTGQVAILGHETRKWNPKQLSTRIGYVFQNPFTQISGIKDNVFEEIAFGLENLGVEREAAMARVQQVVDLVGIRHLVAKNPNEISGGQRQLVAFAAIVAMDTDVIVIDEPTSQLDPETSETVFAIIGTLKQQGKTVVLVEHKVDLMAGLADRIVVLHRGRVLADGPTRDVLTSDAFDRAELRRPEVTEMALALDAAGRGLGSIPITTAEAEAALAPRLQEARHADCAL